MSIKRLVSVIVSLVLMVTMFAGCTSKNEPSAEPKEKEAIKEVVKEVVVEKEKPGSITLMASQNWVKDVDRQLFKQFKEETGIEVKVLLTPDNGYSTLLGTSLSGGSSAVDIFMYAAGSEMVSAGIPDVALDLSGESWVDRLEEWAIAANTEDGKLYGFSTWGVDYEGILYNKSFFKENGLAIPETWEQFLTLCNTIKDLGKIPFYEGINGVWHTQSWLYGMTPVLQKEDPDYIAKLNETPDNKLSSSEKLKEGLGQLKDFFGAKENGQPKYYTNDGQAEDWFGSYIALQNRDTVMMFTYSAYVSELKANGSTDEWGMFPLPVVGNKTGVSNGGGISKYVNKHSNDVESCKKLLSFLADEKNLETYYGARADLVSSAFKNVKAVKPTSATSEIADRSESLIPVMMLKEILYWDPDVYKYFQGFAEGTMTVEQFLNNMDDYRETLFEAAGN